MGAAATLGMQAASEAVSGGIGMVMAGFNDKRQREQQQALQDMQIRGQKEMTNFNMAKQLEMWKNTSYPAQLEMMKKAGLSPGLMYGQGGGGGSTTGNASGSVAGAMVPAGGGEIMGMVNANMGVQLMNAQKELLEAQARNANVDADKKEGVDTANVKADTENKILQQVINKYTGQELKETFERVSQPNRSQMGKTMSDELAARQGIAGTIYEMWQEGKLKDKSIAELESILLGNAKSREEKREIMKRIDLLDQNIKGATLDNVIKDLESRLQTETGIDSKSPTWLKVLGRLFIQLMGDK